MLTYKENILFPKIPSAIEKILIQIQKNQEKPMPHYFSGAGEFKIKKVPGFIHDWVRKNICYDYVGLGVQSIEHGDFDPHIDGPIPIDGGERYYSLLYIIEPGGNNIEDPVTRFYQVKSSIVNSIKDSNNNRLYSHNDVIQIAECQFKKHTWNLINNQCIHSVDNIQSTRICLTLNFKTPNPSSLIKLGLITYTDI